MYCTKLPYASLTPVALPSQLQYPASPRLPPLSPRYSSARCCVPTATVVGAGRVQYAAHCARVKVHHHWARVVLREHGRGHALHVFGQCSKMIF